MIMKWRSFQIAFILLNDAFEPDPRHDKRLLKTYLHQYLFLKKCGITDLVWFPTGGDK
jgi:hypothetical protein